MTEATGPADGPHERVEYAVWAWWEERQRGELTPRSSRERAEAMVDFWHAQAAGPTCTIMQRTVTVGPWVSAP